MLPLPSPSHPSLAPPRTSRTYRVQTDTSTKVRERVVSNSLTTTLRQTHYGRSRQGTDAVLVEVLAFEQTDQSPLAGLLADLHPVHNQLLFEVGTYGELLAIRNLEQLADQWQGLRPYIEHKYGRTPEGQAFIDGFGQQVGAGSEALLSSFRHKGAYGILLPGLFNPVGPAEAVRLGQSARVLPGFFGSIDLPLRLQVALPPAGEPIGQGELRVTGELDPDRFAEVAFEALVKEAMDMLHFRVVHSLRCEEMYTRDAAGWLTAARQELTFTVDNFYHQHLCHELTLV